MTGDVEVDGRDADIDIEASMAETLAEIQAGDDDGQTIEQQDQPTEHEPEPEKAGRDSGEKGERARGPDGKFIKSDNADSRDESEQAAAAGEKEESQQKGGIGQQPGDEQIIQPTAEDVQQETELDPRLARAPTTWRNEAKAKWNNIDPSIREEILKREEDIGRGISTYKADAEYGRAVQQSLQPYMPMINAAGATPNQVVTSMLDTYYKLTSANPQQKAQLLLEAAQQYGADMSVMQQEYDPTQNTVQQQLYPLVQEVQQLKQQLSQRDNQAQQFEQTQAISTIEAFRNATDETGNAKYPYFETVRDHMADLIERSESAGTSMSLEDAYESAIWATPELRQTLLQQQQSSLAERQRKEAAEKAEKAKKAAGVNLQQKGSYDEKPPKPTGSITDTLAETLADIQAR